MNLGTTSVAAPKGRIVQGGYILVDGTACGLWGQPLIALDTLLTVSIR
jgi:hypothetical protein